MDYLRNVLFLLVVLLFLGCLSSCDSLKDSSVTPGSIAPPLDDLVGLDGKPHSLKEFRGKIVILNFLASWCKPCEEEMPSLNRLQEKMGDTLQVVSIGVEDDDDALRDFRDRNKVTFPFLHDKHGYAKQRYRLAGYPETFILDREGKLILFPDLGNGNTPTLKFVGPREWDSPAMIDLLKKLDR